MIATARAPAWCLFVWLFTRHTMPAYAIVCDPTMRLALAVRETLAETTNRLILGMKRASARLGKAADRDAVCLWACRGTPVMGCDGYSRGEATIESVCPSFECIREALHKSEYRLRLHRYARYLPN